MLNAYLVKKQPETFSSLENIQPPYKLKFVISVCHRHTQSSVTLHEYV